MKKSLHLLLAALLVTTVSACNDDPLFEIPCDAPTADAGADQTVTEDALDEGAAVLLDGSASIPAEGDAISTYAWTEDGVPIEGASQGLGQLLATFDVGVHEVTLTVTTVSGCTDTDTVTITVEEFGPVVILPDVTITNPADGDEFVTDGTNIIFEGNAVDANGVEVPPEDLEWTSDVDGVLGTGNTLEVDPGTMAAGPHLITLTGIDADGLEGTADITIVILEPIVVSFADDIQPYFVDSGCTGCHGDALQLGDIRLDSYTEISTGSNANGPLIVAGDAADLTAILIPKLEADHNNGADDQAFVDDFLAQWIDDGAIDN
jgi:hypothetical protein